MSDLVKLNVGGCKFTTTRSTLTNDPDSMLARMFAHEESVAPAAKDEDGAFFIDRDGAYFKTILNFMRGGNLIVEPGISLEGLKAEAEYYGLDSLEEKIEEKIKEKMTSEVVVLNVGGTKMTTTRSTLTKYPDSRLAKMFLNEDEAVKDAEGYYFIDADPVFFGQVIKYLQVGRIMYERGIDYDNVQVEMVRWGVEFGEREYDMKERESDTINNMFCNAKKKSCPEITETALKILNALQNFHFQQSAARKLK